MVLIRAGLSASLMLACAAPPPQPLPPRQGTTTAIPAPGTAPEPTPGAGQPPASPLSCAAPLPAAPLLPPPSAPGATPALAGQMTEQAAQAKRLFDQERWPEAVAAMERVTAGDYGDDAGNRELAEYYRAVALHKSGKSDDAATAFLQIAARSTHLKHAETALWISKVADVTPVVVRGLERYDAAAAARFDNAQQLETHQALLFLLGRERYERGATAEALSFFGQVAPTSRWHQLAADCSMRAKAR